jgi:CRISPR-associated protein Cas1
VDYKAGSPREGDDGIELWPTDRMQLGLQMLLLRENGYACERGIIYYRATKQRVPLEMTPALEAWVLDQISAARNIANGPIPPPLVASPKCVRCSLNSICLPDETRMLGRNAEARRADNGTQVEPQRHRDAENAEARRADNGTRSGVSVAPGARYSPGLPESPCLPSPRRLMAAREDTRLREEEVLRREVIEPFVM